VPLKCPKRFEPIEEPGVRGVEQRAVVRLDHRDARADDAGELNIRGTRAELIARAVVKEVSVLPPWTPPGEPCAEVWSYSRAEVPRSPITTDLPTPKPAPQRAPAFTRRRPRTALDQLYYETFGTDEVVEDTRARLYAEERAKEGVVVRRGDGRVLGVR